MPFVSFGDYEYIPVLSSTVIDQMAYRHLRGDTRAGILPVFELTRHRSAMNLEASVALIHDTVEAPFLIDLDKRYAPPAYQSRSPIDRVAEQQRVERETHENDTFNAYLSSLLLPANGFENWRAVCQRFENAIPVLQYTHPARQANAILRQASLLSQQGNCIALRFGQAQYQELIPITIQILSALPVSAQLLLILDCGQGRRQLQEKADWVLECINAVQSGLEPNQVTGLSAVCMSNSYPQMNHDGLRVIPNCDRQIWLTAYSQFPFHFGDYAASARVANLSSFSPRNYRATVVHSLNDQWLVHRHENSDDPQGWIDGSSIIVAQDVFDPIHSWTDQVIIAAAAGNLNEMGAPRPWHAARIAGHIDRQFSYQPPDDDF